MELAQVVFVLVLFFLGGAMSDCGHEALMRDIETEPFEMVSQPDDALLKAHFNTITKKSADNMEDKDMEDESSDLHEKNIFSFSDDDSSFPTEEAHEELPFDPLRVLFVTKGVFGDTSEVQETLFDNSRTCHEKGEVVFTGKNDANNPWEACSTPHENNCLHTCTVEDIITEEKRHFIEGHILPQVARRFHDLLRVVRTKAKLRLSVSHNCGPHGGVPIPPSFATGANGDLIVFITYRPTFSSVDAWAYPCQVNAIHRPIAAMMNINPSISTNPARESELVGIIAHELMHAMGFSTYHYRSFVPAQAIGLDHILSAGKEGSRRMVITPTVQSYARWHFGCSTLKGAYLDKEGDHWDPQLFAGDFMTIPIPIEPAYTGLSLALLQDSGWYMANFDRAESLAHGAELGCDFAEGDCSVDSRGPFFCDGKKSSGQYFCGPTLRTIGVCMTSKGQCPTVRTLKSEGNVDCRVSSPVLSPKESEDRAEEWGTLDSRCFLSTVNKLVPGVKPIHEAPSGGCYRHHCQNGMLHVKLGTEYKLCPSAGGVMPFTSVEGHVGNVLCPPAASLCRPGFQFGVAGYDEAVLEGKGIKTNSILKHSGDFSSDDEFTDIDSGFV